MRQGEIWYASLDPAKGSEQAGYRPVMILSGNLLNKYLNTVIIVPFTTKIKNYKGNPVLEPTVDNGLKQVSELLIFHIRSVSKDRLIEKAGEVDSASLKQSIITLNEILKY